MLQGKGKLVLWRDGTVAWEMPWGGIHDLHRGEDGKIYVQKDMREVCAIDPAENKVVWSYDSTKSNGSRLKGGCASIARPLPFRLLDALPDIQRNHARSARSRW